jgi:chemotaxis protein methyltransferase CheR
MSLTFEEFKEKAARILNLELDGYKINRVQRRTDSLMHRYNISDYEQCLRFLREDGGFREAYLQHFTINTSEFFRNPDYLYYLRDNILPGLFIKGNRVKIWSAPCSDGSEPYTIAIFLKELAITSNYYILASDLDREVLKKAVQGIYNLNSLRNVPVEILNRYFRKLPGESRKYMLNEEIIEQVRFEKRDLIRDLYPEDWDLILCRNFFIYLTRELKDELIYKFVKVLKLGGYLFLGNTEFIFNPQDYGLQKVYSSLYRKG